MSEGKQIDWSKAPEGATHFTPRRDYRGIWLDVFWRFEDGKAVHAWRVEDDGSLTSIACPSITEDLYARAVQRPVSWSGAGLPPTGIPLEMKHRHADDEWARPGFHVETLAWVGEKRFVVAGAETIGNLDDYEFRPIRTPEQIAAQEREAGIAAIKTIADAAIRRGESAAAAVYDAGYRMAKEDT